MKNVITFTKKQSTNLNSLGLGRMDVVVAIKNSMYVLCLVGTSVAYQPIGGRSTLKNIIDTCKEGETYYWRLININ